MPSDTDCESCLYIGLSFTGPHILSGIIIYLLTAVTSDTHSHESKEFIPNSQRCCDFVTYSLNRCDRCLYIGLSFPGWYILSGRIIYSLKDNTSDTPSHDVSEFIHDSQRCCNSVAYSPKAVTSDTRCERCLYIGLSFPGWYILSGRIIYSLKECMDKLDNFCYICSFHSLFF